MEKSKDGKRNGYYYFDGKEYPSVTKILGILDKPGLTYWLSREATRIALREPDLNEKEVLAKLHLVKTEAADRGKFIHSVIGGGKIAEIPENFKGYYDAYISWLDSHKPAVDKMEVLIKSLKYGYAGRCDMLCFLNGEPWLIDFKTGKDIYKEVGIQLVAYKQGLFEDGIPITHTGVVLLKEDGGFQFEETVDTLSDFLNVFEVWKWIQRKE